MNGEDIRVVQELLRHANSKITMDIYTQALSPAKRQAQSRVTSMILPKTGVRMQLQRGAKTDWTDLDRCFRSQFLEAQTLI